MPTRRDFALTIGAATLGDEYGEVDEPGATRAVRSGGQSSS